MLPRKVAALESKLGVLHVTLAVTLSLIAPKSGVRASGLCQSHALAKSISISAAALFDVGVTHLYPRLRPPR